MSLVSRLTVLSRGEAAFRYAAGRRIPGLQFARFGRHLGLRLMRKGLRSGLNYLLTPVNIVRYFEFPFALSCLPESPGRCLDVSSPRLFSLYVAKKNPSAHVVMINPDAKDISQTAMIASKLRMSNIVTECCGVDALSRPSESYDCIWSISVVEHICGDYDDREAIRLMYSSLSPGGRLIITVPVDRQFKNEYRDVRYYGTQTEQKQNKYFFQRFYDKAAIWERFLRPIDKEPSIIRWFGETTPGRFAEYERRWMREGHNCTVDDPREIADHYREFSTWEEMPGMGVCGIIIHKTKS